MDDLEKDDDLRKSVIDQMMGELDDVTASSLKRKPGGPVKGVEIAITVTPKSDEAESGEDAAECTEEGCEDPMHEHGEEKEEEPESSDYISQLMKKLG